MLIFSLAKATKQRSVIDKTPDLRVGLGICGVLSLGWLTSLGVPWLLLTGAVVVLLRGRLGSLGVVVLPVSGICFLIFHRRSGDRLFDNMLCEWPVELICENFVWLGLISVNLLTNLVAL